MEGIKRFSTYATLSAFALILIFPISVQALGISPAGLGIQYEPGVNKTYAYYVRGEGGQMKVRIWSRGLLSDMMKPSEDIVILQPGEVHWFNVVVSMPENIDRFGVFVNEVVATQVVEQTGAEGIGAYSEVSGLVWIAIPYPYKFIEVKITAPNVALSKPVPFSVGLTSRGKENTTASGIIIVNDSEGKTATTLYIPQTFVETLKTETVNVVWNALGAAPGKYFAKAIVEYGGDGPGIGDTEFKIGDVLIKIENISYNTKIRPDDIVRFDLDLESYWNEKIDDIYMTLEATGKEGKGAGSSKSESSYINSWERKKITIYWDTKGLDEGEYQVTFKVNYRGKVTEKSINVELRNPSEIPYMLILVAAIIAAAVIIALLYMRKRKKASR